MRFEEAAASLLAWKDRLDASDLSALALPCCGVLLVVWTARLLLGHISVKSLIRNLPGPRNDSWFTGNFPEVYDVLNFKFHREATRNYPGIFQVNGMFGDEQLYITDSRALHHIIVKEQAIFEEPQSLLAMNRALMGNGLLATLGNYHKKQRRILTPIFAVKHMRDLVPIFYPITQKLVSVLSAKLAYGAPEQELDLYEWVSRTMLEFIGQGGLGVSLDSLVDGETSDHAKLVKEMVPTLSRMHIIMQLLPFFDPIFAVLPLKLRQLMLERAPLESVRKLKRITDQLEATSQSILNQRRAKVVEEIKSAKGERGRDILGVLLRAQYEDCAENRLPDTEVSAHITTLVFAAQDTTSSAISRILQCLSENRDAQQRLRDEIRLIRGEPANKKCEEWDYDELMRLPFLDAVVRETLRLYNPVSWIWRVARQPTTLPLRHPIKGTDGSMITSVPVAKNQQVIIGIAAANRDQEAWGKDAWQWNPERWLARSGAHGREETGSERGKEAMDMRGGDELQTGVMGPDVRYPGIYSGMMTFSGGRRSCIGFKFAILAIKIVIAELVGRFNIRLPDEEIVWNMNHIAAPTMQGRTGTMPLKVAVSP